jgi:hypothetical protein
MFYQKSFERKMIWTNVRPQNRENAPAPARWRCLAGSFRRFAAERFVQSEQTQKQSCRARQGLSIDIN